MPLDTILDAIRAETDAEIRRVRAAADAEVEAILGDAQARAEMEEERVSVARDAPAAAEERRIVNGARLEVERSLRRERAEAYDDVLDQVRERLAGLRESDEYPELFRRLLDEARNALPGGGIVRIDPRDRDLISALAASVPDRFDPEPVLETCGGLDLAGGDGVVVRNTLEGRLQRAMPELRRLAVRAVPELGEAP